MVNGRARISRMTHGDLLAARPLQTKGNRARIALVGIRTSLLAGDRLEIQVRVGAGVQLEIVEPAGTVAYNAQGERSDWYADLQIEPGATLIWHAESFVAAHGSNAHRSTKANLADDARLLIKENLVLGRSGENEVCLHSATNIHQDSHPMLVEQFTIDETNDRLPGILAPNRVLGTVIAAGWYPQGDTNDPHRLDLAAPGVVYRTLGQTAHAVTDCIDPVFRAWVRELRSN